MGRAANVRGSRPGSGVTSGVSSLRVSDDDGCRRFTKHVALEERKVDATWMDGMRR